MQSCCLQTFTLVRRITVSYPGVNCSVRYSNVTIAYMGLYSLGEIIFFPQPEVGHWPSDISLRRYGRPTLATTGLLVIVNNIIEHYHTSTSHSCCESAMLVPLLSRKTKRSFIVRLSLSSSSSSLSSSWLLL